MVDEPVSLAEEIVMALIVQLLRRGLIDETDIEAAAAGLSEEAQHLVNCAIIEAAAPPESEWSAEQARSRFRVVKPGD